MSTGRAHKRAANVRPRCASGLRPLRPAFSTTHQEPE